jgi:Na+-transporting NADH:ubiquinone oxidoreductase subunit NqrE
VVAALGGGALIALGALLDWSGVSYSSSVDRGVCIAAAVIAVVIAVIADRGRERLPLLLLIPAALALNMAVINIRDIARHHFEYADYPDASVGVGLYLVTIGAVLVGLAALTGFVDRRRRRR